MKLKILKELLLEGLEIINKISIKKSVLPILKNCLIETEKNFLKISATNLESGIMWWGLSKIEKEGKICVDAKFFLDVVSSIKEKIIELESENNILKVNNKNVFLKIKGNNVDEFPIIPKISSKEKISVNSKDLLPFLEKIINIPSPSFGRPEIFGVCFLFENDNLKVVATDNIRLAEGTVKLFQKLEKNFSFILPQDSAKEIVGILKDVKDDINFYFSPNQIFIEILSTDFPHPKIIYTSKLIEGDFPNYQEIIPKEYKTKVIIKKEEFLSQIKIAKLFAGKTNEIKLKINSKEGKIEISGESLDYGEFKSEIFSRVEGEDISISFNYRFLMDGISSFDNDEIEFCLTDVDKPAILNSKDYFYILMPIK